ncbi:MAG: DUF1624 domain-containing protein [Fischerella sp. CENA71]|nr:DUF1624 domain-containing protein [Fischerella sp. CENA71]
MSRNQGIDVTKGLLTIGMVFAHAYWLVGKRSESFDFLTLLASVTCFPGFLFCFGYSSYLAYYSKPKLPYKKIFQTLAKIIVAFYICGLTYRVVIEHSNVTLWSLIKLLTLTDTPPYSQFLPSFAITLLLGSVFVKQVLWVTRSLNQFVIVSIFFISFTFINYQAVDFNQLALLIGSTKFNTFPVLQFFPLYLAGVYFAKRKIVYAPPLLILLITTSGASLTGYVILGIRLLQYPPSAVWITSGMSLVYLCYLTASQLSKVKLVQPILSNIGQNVLFYLVLSNLFIFATKAAHPTLALSTPKTIVYCIGLLIIIYANYASINK